MFGHFSIYSEITVDSDTELIITHVVELHSPDVSKEALSFKLIGWIKNFQCEAGEKETLDFGQKK